jgi:hypothetical protein
LIVVARSGARDLALRADGADHASRFTMWCSS